MAQIVMGLVKGQFGSELKLEQPRISAREFLVASGNDAIAMAKIVAGGQVPGILPNHACGRRELHIGGI
ncbi:hypothetical protein [Vulcanisaeta souniana]|uniref:hypothetical protein n=1 Tax=Vulcanisaeta souniana TaxID=164452 RepID=UPI000AE31A20|nr:hypothetical protein [Vulcanisaeta souniana]